MLSVFHLITELDIGGAERQLAVLLPRLNKYCRNTVVCLTGRGPIGVELEPAGIRVIYLDGTSQYDLRLPYRLWRLLRQEKPDVTITYLIYADITGRITSRLAGIRTIITSQRSSLVGRQWLRLLDRATSRLVTHYHVQTEAAKEELSRTLHVSNDRFSVIPNAVAIPTSPAPFRPSPNPFTLTCVSNLKPGKGHRTLLEAVAILKQKHPHTKLLLAGTGSLHQRLKITAKQLNLATNVQLLSSVSDIPALLKQTNIFILPTEGEGMSNALLEAMSHGLACIATDIPANRALITHKANGLLIPPGDSEQLTVAIRRLITETETRQRLGRAARAFVQEHHTPDKVSRQWLNLITATNRP